MNVGSISRFVLRNKLLVTLVWLVIFVVGAATVSRSVGALTRGFDVPGREGSNTNNAIVAEYGILVENPPLVPVVVLPEGITVDSPGIRDELAALDATVLAAVPGARIASLHSTGDSTFVSADGRTVFSLVTLPSSNGDGTNAETAAVKSVLAGSTVASSPVKLTSYSDLEDGGGSGGGPSVLLETFVGGLGALIILIWVFGSFLALVPILMAAVAIVTTFLTIWGVTTFASVSFIVEFLIALIGLGIAIDYSLLIVTRWREERALGYENQIAVQRAMETAGSAVVFSGTTVAIGLLALVVLPVPFLRSVGYGGMLIPFISVIVAITLLPVILATVGPRLDWPALRKGDQHSRIWTAWARLVIRRRWIVAAASVTILAVMISPVFSLLIGDPQSTSLSTSGEAQEALVELIDSRIGAGVLIPFEVLVDSPDPAASVDALSSVANVRAVVAPDNSGWRTPTSSRLLVLPAVDANSSAGITAFEDVRSAAHQLPGAVRLGGVAATNRDFVEAVYGNFFLMVVLISIVTFVLLTRAFRSIILPLKAIALNIASVGAALGLMTFFWQQGHGSGFVWGYSATGSITTFIPLMVFAFLFGLSMDYEVFILARMREEYDIDHDTNGAIVRGIGTTGRLVTSAALILVLAFSALGSGPEIFLKVFATTIAAGVLLDATLIRALLVPAMVSLFGKWNWWLPTRLERLVPHPTPLQRTLDRSRPSD